MEVQRKSRKGTPASFPRRDLICPYFVQGTCYYGERCRAKHSVSARQAFIRRGTDGKAPLSDKKGPNVIDFFCFICDRLLVKGGDIHKLKFVRSSSFPKLSMNHQNCIWTNIIQKEPMAIWIDPHVKYHPFKKCNTQRVFCRCGWFIGDYFESYRATDDGTPLKFKLEFLARTKDEAMGAFRPGLFWRRSRDAVGEIDLAISVPESWQAPKRDAEKEAISVLNRHMQELKLSEGYYFSYLSLDFPKSKTTKKTSREFGNSS